MGPVGAVAAPCSGAGASRGPLPSFRSRDATAACACRARACGPSTAACSADSGLSSALRGSQAPSRFDNPASLARRCCSGVACHARQKLRRKNGPAGEASAEDVLKDGEEVIFSLGRGWSEEFRHLSADLNADQPDSLPRDDVSSGGRPAAPGEDGEKLPRKQAKKGREPIAPPATRTTHRMLKVMAGELRGKKLLSPADRNVRPMMEMVRGAVFSMVQAMAGSPAFLPGGRWLDLYSGTGSVGIEALSRGCDSAHFVEMDPWVVSSVLSPNLAECNYLAKSLIHTLRVEPFLERAQSSGASHVGGPFEFISVTPPYEAVQYSELMATLDKSPLIGESSCMVVEYPLLSKHELPETCGPLIKVRDRKYGRTNVAIYGPAWIESD